MRSIRPLTRAPAAAADGLRRSLLVLPAPWASGSHSHSAFFLFCFCSSARGVHRQRKVRHFTCHFHPAGQSPPTWATAIRNPYSEVQPQIQIPSRREIPYVAGTCLSVFFTVNSGLGMSMPPRRRISILPSSDFESHSGGGARVLPTTLRVVDGQGTR